MEHLLEFCETERQRQHIEALIEHGDNQTAAAKSMGIGLRGFSRTIKRIKAKANQHDGAPDGFFVQGKSTLRNAGGNTIIEWTKTNIEKQERHELLMETVVEVFEKYKGTIKCIKPQRTYPKHLLNLIPMGDPHLGMYAWAEECGEDFDCDIAERDLIGAVTQLIEDGHSAETCIILNLGDFFHVDNSSNTTPGNANPLDMDTRWGKVLQIGVKVMIACIMLALKKHKKVVVKNIIGNHDPHTAQVLSIALSCFFSKNKRVHIDISPHPFWYYRFGKCLFGSTHGDKVKPANLPLIMASDRAKDWGRTENGCRYFHTGHIHHDNVTDFVGCRWESHRTLAASDSWHTSKGYRSASDMKIITYHKDFGEIARYTTSLARVRSQQKGK